jgi:tRNA pseudouridine55 synthase
MDGLILIDKPEGISSAIAVEIVKRRLPRGTKLGHAGTLDPFATGLLIVMAGRATKQSESLMGLPKTYEATIKFGATTETDDPTSAENPWPNAKHQSLPVDRAAVDEAIQAFVGEIVQRPPVYSALKVGGKRACDRVRDGHKVELKSRVVCVYGIQVVEYQWPSLRVRIDCGRGTYIRSIARDMGEKLNVGAYLTQLRRTRIGGHDVANAIAPETVTIDVTPG